MAEDEKKQTESSPYSLTVSIIQNKLNMHLHDKKTKNIYKGVFTSDQLQKCGFSNKQTENLGGICKFIATAKSGHNNLKFSISIEQESAANDGGNVNDNNNNDIEGVYGVDASETASKAAKVESKEVGVVKIVKEDDFFGSMQFVMKLQQMPRKQSDVNQDHIKDLKQENLALKQQLNVLQQQFNESRQKLNALNENELKQQLSGLQQEHTKTDNKTVTLQQQLNELKQNNIKNDDELKQQLEETRAKTDELAKKNAALQRDCTKTDDQLKDKTAELQQQLNELQQKFAESQQHLNTLQQHLNGIKQDYTKSAAELERSKSERAELAKKNLALQQQLNKLKNAANESKEEYARDLKKTDSTIQQQLHEMGKHDMPKGSILIWAGTIDSVPKGWRICDGKGGTPDLRDRFIIGSGRKYNVKQTGGDITHSHQVTVNGHTLTVQEIPSHRHDFYNNVWVHGSNNNYYICDNSSKKKILNHCESGDGNWRTKPIGGGRSHNHTAYSSPTAHLPPYFAVCFIMKKI